MKASIILLLVLAGSAWCTPLDTLWTRSFEEDSSVDIAYAVRPHEERLLLAGGKGGSPDFGMMLAWLDYDGNLMNRKFAPTPGHTECVYDAAFTSRNSALMCGCLLVHNPTRQYDSVFAAEVDFDGQIRWYISMATPFGGLGGAVSVCETSHGRYVVAGWTQVWEGGYTWDTEIFFLWVDSLGDILRLQRVDLNEGVYAYDNFRDVHLAPTADGGVIAVASPSYQVSVLKLDSGGQVVWHRRHWCNSLIIEVGGVRVTDNGDVVIVGVRGGLFGSLFVMRCDSLGNQLWYSSPGVPRVSEVGDVIQTLEGRYLVVGTEWPSGWPEDMFVVSLDANGVLHDYAGLRSPHWGSGLSGIQLADSTFVLCGSGCRYYGNGSYWPGFYAARLTADNRVPAPPSSFDLMSPPDGASVACTQDVQFMWFTAVDPDPLDAVSYRLRIWNETTDWLSDAQLTTTCSVPVEILCDLGAGWFSWQVIAHSNRPDTSITSSSTRSLYVEPSAAEPAELVPFSTGLTIYPNPLNPTGVVVMDLARRGVVNVQVFDVLGRRAANLANGVFEAGRYELNFDARALPTGIYFVQMQAAGQVVMGKAVVVK